MTTIAAIFGLAIAVILFLMVRVTIVTGLRITMIYRNWPLYSVLPSQEASMFHPKYYHMWTYNQWARYGEHLRDSRETV